MKHGFSQEYYSMSFRLFYPKIDSLTNFSGYCCYSSVFHDRRFCLFTG